MKRIRAYLMLAFGALLLLGFVGDAHGNVRYRSQFGCDAFNRPTSIAVGMDLSGGLQGAGGIGGLLARSEMSAYGDASHAYYHSDALGNVTTLVDSNQRIAARYLYDPFGNTLSAVGPLAQANTYQFSSKELHANSGFYYYGYRFYDPATQRFLNRDPLGESGGINLYGFVYNNPIHHIDSDGRFVLDDEGFPAAGSYNGFGAYLYDKDTKKQHDKIICEAKRAAKDAVKEAVKLGLMIAATEGLGMAADAGLALRNSSRLANAAKGGTEVVQRAMSRAELAATESSGLLRGGRSGTHYASDAVNSSAGRAQQRLALPQTPEVRVTLEVPSGRFSPPSRVQRNFNMPGGGMERTASGNVPVRVLRVDEY